MMGLEEIKEANRDPKKFYRSRLSPWERGEPAEDIKKHGERIEARRRANRPCNKDGS